MSLLPVRPPGLHPRHASARSDGLGMAGQRACVERKAGIWHGALLALTLWLGIAPGASALSSDRDQPINIRADRVRIDEHKGISEYSGHVELTQGSIVLTADQLTVYQSQGKLQRIEAHGTPARFKQLPDNSRKAIEAYAEQMEYRAGSERLLLTGQARVTQGGNVFSGHTISYDTRRSTVTARKDDSESGGGRVHAIIQPAGSANGPANGTESDKSGAPPTPPSSGPTTTPPSPPAQ